tara:strand:+ start:472 stop:831 length:360 start_codon:yes stop_codon:yes gene_type:complete
MGDLLANLVVGALIGWFSWLLIDTGWNMMIAMILMMIVGMIIATLLWLPFSVLFGAMEVMVPLMLTGMLSGMVAGMYLTMEPLGAWSCLHIGAASGFVSIVMIWIFNNAVRGTEPAPWR